MKLSAYAFGVLTACVACINAEPYIGAGDPASPEDLVLRPGAGGDTIINGMSFSDLIALVQSQNRTISELRAQLTTQAGQITALTTQSGTQNHQISALDTQAAAQAGQISALDAQANVTASRVDAIQGPTVFKWSGYTSSVVTQQNQGAAWAAVASATQTAGIVQIQGHTSAGNYGLFAAARADNFIVWTFSVKSMTRFNISANMGNGGDSATRQHHMSYSLNLSPDHEKVWDFARSINDFAVLEYPRGFNNVRWREVWHPIEDHTSSGGRVDAPGTANPHSHFGSGGQTHTGTVPFGSSDGIGFTGFISIKLSMIGNPSVPWVSWRTISLHPICDSYSQVKPLATYRTPYNNYGVGGGNEWSNAGEWHTPGVCIGQGC